MEECYIQAFRCVSERFSKTDKLFYFYVSALYGLLTRYSDYKKIVIDVFKKCDFFIEEGSMDEILKRHNINNDEYDDDYISDSKLNTTYGVSNQGHEFYISDNGEISHKISKPFIAISTTNACFEHLLNVFCHEMGHLIKGEVNNSDIDEDSNKIDYYIRTGLAYYYYSYDKNEDTLSSGYEFSILDEGFNTLETTEIMKIILTLKDISIDEGLSKFISSLDQDELLKDRGYDEILDVIRELWNNSSFRYLVFENEVENGCNDIEEFFDNFVGEGSLSQVDCLLEEAFDLTDSDCVDHHKVEELKKQALDIITKFNLQIKKMIKQ